jgi:hypothetical protein
MIFFALPRQVEVVFMIPSLYNVLYSSLPYVLYPSSRGVAKWESGGTSTSSRGGVHSGVE